LLQSIRDRAQGLVAGVIVFLIILTFALWGIQEYLNAARQVSVAEVNGEDIDLVEYQKMLSDMRQQAQALLQDAFDPEEWSQESTRRRVLDRLVDERILLQAAERAKIRVGDFQLAENIRLLPQFLDADGKFSNDVYQQRLRSVGETPEGFQQDMRRALAIQQLQNGVANSAFAITTDAAALERLRLQKRDIGFALIPAVTGQDATPVADERIQRYYDEHQDTFIIPEKVRLEYVRLSVRALEHDVSVDDTVLQSYYDEHVGDYTVEEQRAASHILLELAEDAAKEQEEAARNKALDLIRMIKDGASFEDLAKQHSQDAGSAGEGGDLGVFGRGVMVPEFENAVFAMPQGEVSSEPVRTPFGFHIIRLNEVRPGHVKTFEEARADVEQAYRREQAEQLFGSKVEDFSNLVYEHSDSLETVAQSIDSEVERTDLLSRAEIAERFNQRVADAAFSQDVLVDQLNSEPIDLSDGETVSVRVAERTPQTVQPLAVVRDQIAASLRAEDAREHARQRGEALLEKLRAGGAAPQDIVGAEGLTWETRAAAQRDSVDPAPAVVAEAFRTPLPPGADHADFGVSLANGDYAVARVSNIQNAGADQITEPAVATAKRTLSGVRAQNDWQRFVEGLRSQAKIRTYPENI
jgi:peptidyl-prolyl cis-trans isomerase D